MTGFEVITLLPDEEVTFLTWKIEAVASGGDTFVMRDDKIAVQTVAMPADCAPPEPSGARRNPA